MNLASHTAPAAPASTAHPAQDPAASLPAWVARVGQASRHSPAKRSAVGPGPRTNERSGFSGALRLLRLLRDPQSWITAIAVLTLVGLSGGAFEAEEPHSERSALHLHSGMTNDAVVAELSSSQR